MASTDPGGQGSKNKEIKHFLAVCFAWVKAMKALWSRQRNGECFFEIGALIVRQFSPGHCPRFFTQFTVLLHRSRKIDLSVEKFMP